MRRPPSSHNHWPVVTLQTQQKITLKLRKMADKFPPPVVNTIGKMLSTIDREDALTGIETGMTLDSVYVKVRVNVKPE